MSNVARVAGQAANTLTKPLNVEEVFSTYLYEGTSATNTINNGIDLAGEGGIVWIKNRDQTDNHYIFGGEDGNRWSKLLQTNTTGVYGGAQNIFDGVSSTGFTVKSDFGGVNTNGEDYTSWTFRKAPKFFDVVTYTGTGSARSVSHDLGHDVGMVIVKKTSGSSSAWRVWHRGLGGSNYLTLSSTAASASSAAVFSSAPTSTQINLGASGSVNASGESYVAYIFAHNDGDGNFGPDGDADIIKCGSYTGNGSADGPEIDLGFEPQWVMIKRTDSTADWVMQDVMRGMIMDTGGAYIKANDSAAEFSTTGYIQPEPSGFKVRGTASGQANASGANYIYIAIRRGPMAVPESATDVFHIDDQSTSISEAPRYRSGFVTDFYFWKEKHTSTDWTASTRLLGTKILKPNLTNAETNSSIYTWDFMEGALNVTSVDANKPAWMWRRAPNYFDVVAYTGDGNFPRTNDVKHNLGVAPEMIWIKNRDQADDWAVYHAGVSADPETDYLHLNSTVAVADSAGYWYDTAPTATSFKLGNQHKVNASGEDYIAYLFASLDGISKVGSVSHTTGSNTDVDCGFSAGARFVILKGTHASGWQVFDTERGIVTGNDATLTLHATSAEDSSQDRIDPYSSGFSIGPDLATGTYIFYAIA